MWYMVEVFKCQSSKFTPYCCSENHPPEKPYKYRECGNILGFMRIFILDRSQIYMYLLVRSLEHEFILERLLTDFINVKKRKKTLSSHLTSHQQYQTIYPGENTQQCNVCGKDLTQKSQDRNIVGPCFPDSVVVANPLPFSLYVFSDDFSSGTQELQ